MAEFRSGDLDVLVATTVIEVGVDIPEASVMVIEDADRFGIAQLHQLRGRVGPGDEPAWCYLLSESDAPEAEARLAAMEASTDGFVLAEVDLAAARRGDHPRGPPEGTQRPQLARLVRPGPGGPRPATMAVALVDADPGSPTTPLLVEELRLFIDDDEAEFLFKS